MELPSLLRETAQGVPNRTTTVQIDPGINGEAAPSSALSSEPNKVQDPRSMSDDMVNLLCSFGGNFTHHKGSGKVFYMGGKTRLVCVERSIGYPKLLLKMVELSKSLSGSLSIKFQFPGMSLDSPLISVECDDDVRSMMDQCDSNRISVFLFPDQTVLTPVLISTSRKDAITQQRVRNSVTPEECGNTSIESAIREPPLVLRKECAYEDGGNISTESVMWEYSLEIGKEFPDAHSLRGVLLEFSVVMNFELQIIRTDSRRFTAKCKADGCPWRIHASRVGNLSAFKIKTFQPLHSCSRQNKLSLRPANVKWIVGVIEKRFRDGTDYETNDIIKDIQREFGILIDYKKACRVRKLLMNEIRGTPEESFGLLPSYCEQIRITNPGSIVSLDVSEDKAFQRLFLAFHASITGFARACRPLIELGSIHTGAKYSDVLLLATSVDADGEMFPLASAVVTSENDGNWNWFLSEIKKLLPDDRRLTIISGTQKGLIDGITKVFPDAFHGYCMSHLCEDMPMVLKHTRITELFRQAAGVVTARDFYACMESIAKLSPEASEWIRKTPPKLWATSYFKGHRYSCLTLNVSEYCNGWVDKAKDLLILEMVDTMHVKVMKMFSERCESGLKWTSVLVPSAEAHISRSKEEARSHQVTNSSPTDFEVGHTCHKERVDIAERMCTCRRWQVDGLPCSHAIASLLSQNLNVYEYCDSCFTVDSYRKTYSETIHPVPDKSQWPVVNDIEVKLPDIHICPECPKRKPMRQKQNGHGKRKCKEEGKLS